MTSHHRKGHQKETWSAMVSFTSSSLHVLPGLGWQRHVFAELHVPAARFRSGSGLQDCSGFRFTGLRTRSCQCGLLILRCVQTGRDASTAAFAVSAAPPLLAALAWGVQTCRPSHCGSSGRHARFQIRRSRFALCFPPFLTGSSCNNRGM